MSHYDVTKVRETLEVIGRRAQQDPAYKAQVRANPAAAMRDAGVPEEVVNRLTEAAQNAGSDVGGYAMRFDTPICTPTFTVGDCGGDYFTGQ